MREVVDDSFEALKSKISHAITDVAWIFLDVIPNCVQALVEAYHAFRDFSVEDAWAHFVEFVVSIPGVLWEWFVSLFDCPRQQTYFLFWSYPQSYYCTWYNAHYGRWRQLSVLDTYILTAIFGLVFLCGSYAYTVWWFATLAVRPWEQAGHWMQKWLYGYAYPHYIDLEYVRNVFRQTPIPTRKPVQAHPHGDCAASRSTASAFIHTVIDLLNHRSWIYQMSRNDQAKGFLGLRTPFWSKDLTTRPRNDPLARDSAIVMVDVDYYVDMHKWLCSNFRPHFFYTLQPSKAGYTGEDYAYTFKDNEVHYYVAGSATPYVHKVWNYQVDNISVTRRICGFPYSRATYHVERRNAGGDHEIVMLWPLREWKWWNACLANVFIGEEPLERFSPKVGNYNRVVLHTRAGGDPDKSLIVSTSVEGSFTSVSIPHRYDEELHNVSELGHNKLAYPTVQQTLSGHGVDDGPGAKVLTMFNRELLKGAAWKAVVPSAFHYQFLGPRYDPDAKTSMVAFMDPLALPACSPKQCYENEKEMIEKRVVEPRAPEMPLSMFMENCMDDFLKEFIPDDLAGTFHPQDMDYVLEKQKRPSQRRIIENSEFDESDRPTLQTFMKKEPKTDIKAPRNITQYEGDTKVAYSMFMYTLAEYLKTTDWYAFGKTPEAIARDIAEIAAVARKLVPSDGRTFDAHVSNLVRHFEWKLLTRLFHHKYHAQLHKLHSKQFGRAARTTMGVIYELFFSRGSGSAETSGLNSALNKFIAFVANILEFPDAGPTAAYKAPGKYGGDDGVSANISAVMLRKAASMLGQDYAAADVERGESFSFLSRKYSPAVWCGRLDSVCDLERSLRGFNLTVSLPGNVTPVMKLIEKSRAYYLSDRNTPIIGELAQAVMAISGTGLAAPAPELYQMVSFNSRLDIDVQYPNDVSEDDYHWMGIPEGFDHTRFREWLKGVLTSEDCAQTKLKKLLHPPYCDARTPPIVGAKEAAVNDTVVQAPEPVTQKPKFVPCAKCSKPTKPASHTVEFCWSGLSPAEKKKRVALLPKRNAK